MSIASTLSSIFSTINTISVDLDDLATALSTSLELLTVAEAGAEAVVTEAKAVYAELVAALEAFRTSKTAATAKALKAAVTQANALLGSAPAKALVARQAAQRASA